MKNALKRGLSILLAITIIFSSAYVGLGEVDFSKIKFNGINFGRVSEFIKVMTPDFSVKSQATSESDLTFTLNTDGESYSVTDCNESVEDELVIPDTYNGLPVTSIGDNAFYNCGNLTSITIPDSVTSIGVAALMGHTSLISITVDSDSEYYSSVDGVLFNKDKTTLIQYPAGKENNEYSIPNSVKSIGDGAFDNCTSLISVIIPDSVTNIGAYAFCECTNLGSITIPDSVTSIGSWAFYACINLTSITISDNITSIDANSFSGTGYYDDSSNWEDNVLYIGDCLISGYDVENSYSIKSGTRIIADKAFNGCENLTSIVIPDSVTSIGNYVFFWCTSLTSISVEENNVNYSSGDGVLFNKDKTNLIQYPTANADTEYAIPDTVTKIEEGAFSYCENLTSIRLGKRVANIGEGAFYGCLGLTTVLIPVGVKEIGYAAFSACESLTDVYYPGTDEEWNNITICEDNELLVNATIHYGPFMYSVENGTVTITGYIGTDTNVVIPSEIEGLPVTAIGEYGFCLNEDVLSVIVPDSVTTICDYAFAMCPNLVYVDFGENVKTIGEYVFYCYYGSIVNFTLPETVTEIHEYAFATCWGSNLYFGGTEQQWAELSSSLYIGDNINVIFDYPQKYDVTDEFSYIVNPDGTAKILRYFGTETSMTFPSKIDGYEVYEIGAFIFGLPLNIYEEGLKPSPVTEVVISDGIKKLNGCFNLYLNITSIELPDSIVDIGELTFRGGKMTSFEIPNGVKTIGRATFEGNHALQSVTIPKSVTNINSAAFSRTGLTDVYYYGSESDWEKIIIEDGNEPLINATVHFVHTHNYSDWVVTLEPTCTEEGSRSKTCYECGGVLTEAIETTGHYYTNGYCTTCGTEQLFEYSVENDQVTITGCIKNEGVFEIPSKIDGLPVTTISDNSFGYVSNLEYVFIPESIKEIGDSVFEGSENLISIDVAENNPNYISVDGVLFDKSQTTLICFPAGKTDVEYIIPDSVKKITDSAFSSCKNLTSIAIPDGVTTIGNNVFYNCTNLISIVIPDSVTTIGEDAFFECRALSFINVADDNNNYCSVDGVLFNKDKTTLLSYPACKIDVEYTIPDSVTRIEGGAFWRCVNLEFTTIPNSVQYIGSNFYMCTNLISVEIPDSVTSLGEAAFYGCTKLESVTLSKNLEEILYGSFIGCAKLTSIVIPDSVTTIDSLAFGNCSGLKSVIIPDSVKLIGWHSFYNCNELSYVFYTGTENDWYNIGFLDSNTSLSNAVIHYNTTDHTYETTVLSQSTCTEDGLVNRTCTVCGLTVENEEIPALGHDYSTEWTIDKAATCTEDGSKSRHCSRCNSTTDVTVIAATGHNYVDGYCTYCDSCIAFEYTVENGAVTITGYTGNRADVVIPDEIDGLPVVAIGEYAFSNSGFISSVVIPDSVTNIDELAFEDCYYLSTFSVAENSLHFSSVDGVLFNKDQTELVLYPLGKTDKKYTIPETVKKIGDYAFVNNTMLSEITIPGNVETIGSYAFNCAYISSINLNEGLKTIEKGAFSGCSALMSIIIPNSVTNIGEFAFSGCYGLSTIAIPENITSIPAYAFYYCGGLKEVSFTNNLISIGERAFGACDNLNSVFYDGSLSEWYGVEIGDFNDSIYNAVIHWDSTGHEMVNDVCQVCGLNIWSYETYDDHIVITGYNGVKSDVVIPDTIKGLPVTEIGESAFEDNDSLKTISFGKNVTKIGANAFWDCSNLSSVDISEGIIEIGSSAFARCGELKSVTIPESVSIIDSGAFSYCFTMRSLEVESGNEYFSSENGVLFNKDKTTLICYPSGNYAETYLIPETVKTIDIGAFCYNVYLKILTIPGHIENIGEGAINTCINLENVIIENGVKNIDNYAFSDCMSLTSIDIPESVETIGVSPFVGCINLTSINVDENNSNYTDDAGVLFDKDKTTLVQYPEGKTNTEYTIPDSVIKIGDWALSCGNLTSITIPESVISIGDSAFNYWLEYIFYGSSESDWANITNDSIDDTNAIIHYNATDHTYETTVITEVTCTEDGLVNRTCTVCGLTVENEEIPALGHDYSSEWTIDKAATCTEDGSKSRHCSRCDSTTDVTVIAATGHLYGNLIVTLAPTCTEDGSQSKTCSVCGDVVTEVIDALGHDYSSEWTIDKAATCTEDGSKSHHCSRCDSKTEVTVIEAIGHLYGDWIIDTESTVLSEGAKHRICSVCNNEEAQVIEKIEIDIESNGDYGLAVFTVVHAQTLEPISGAQIFISTENDGENTFTTDSNGQVSVVLPVGKQVISAYAEGCLTRNLKINVKPGVNKVPKIGLSEISTYDAEITSKLMTIEEIEAAGIDTNDPDNQHVYKYELKLEFVPEIDWVSFFYYMNGAGDIIGGGSGGGSGDSDGSGSSSGGGYPGGCWVPNDSGSGGHFYIPAIKDREAITVYPVSEYFYLIIRGEVKWLKEMFDVEMLVINNSLTDTLEDLTATLDLPEGLSLAKMFGEQQELAQQIDHIGEGESESVHWYVRGDKEGSYDLQARLQGTIMPFEEEIDDLFIAENQLQVLAGSALKLHFEFPDAAYHGEDYPITITLTNVSDRTLYNISHMVQIEQGMEVYYSDGTSKTKVDTSSWISSGIIREFNPGDKIIIETTVNIFFESEMMQKEIEKYIGLIDGIEQLINGMKAISTAFDATKMLINCVDGCSKAISNFIESSSDTSDKMKLFKQLHDKVSSLSTKYSTSGNKTIDAAVDLANSGLNASLNAITSDPDLWLANHSAEDIKGLLDDISALENSIVSSGKTSKKFNIFDSIRTAISAIPIRFALKNVIITEDENNTTSIPWSYSTSAAGPQYFGVSNVSKYLMSIVQAMGAEVYEESMPGIFQLIPGLDDPFNKDEAIKYIQATENEIAQFKAKDATGEVKFKVWVERNEASTYSLRSTSIANDFTLSCDNKTATYEDGVLTFTGDGMISVTPKSQTGGTLYIEDSEGNTYTYVIDVVEQHTCTSGEREVIISPTSNFDGFAVKCCIVCSEIMEIEPLAYSDCCEEHTFADWVEDEKESCTDSSLRSRYCTVCGFTETEVVSGVSHTFVGGVCTVCGTEKSEEPDYIETNFTIAEINSDSYKLVSYIGTEADVVIPATYDGRSITTIASSCFRGNKVIKTVEIEDGVTSIGFLAFMNCTALEKVTIPESVTSIGAQAFYGFKGTIYCTIGSYAHEYAVANNIKYVLKTDCEPEKPIQETENTEIDYNNFVIRTSVQNCNDITEILGLSESAMALPLASYVSGNFELYGTGTIITVFDGNDYVGDFTLIVEGDTNGDSICDVLDAFDIERASSGHTELSGAYAMAADSNADDIIDINDYQSVANKALVS